MTSHGHHHDHSHEHEHSAHPHSHGAVVDPTILSSQRGIWALRWSFFGLFVTALIQAYVFWLSQSVALLADTIHNFGDAATAIPLWVAFTLATRKPTKRFTYGLGRAEDLAGILIVLIILFSAVAAAYESILRFIQPQEVHYLWAVMVASLVGFLGNEGVALFRIKVGKEIESAALVADGYHARVDGIASLAVLVGAIGIKLGFPLADPIVGLLISILILKITWDSIKTIFVRVLDGVEPGVVQKMRAAASGVPGVERVDEIRARWSGHRLLAEMNVAVASTSSVAEGHEIADRVRQMVHESIEYLDNIAIHVDPTTAAGEQFHKRTHSHGEHDVKAKK
jgi:cation diffusion facilitator family transporter